VPNATSKSQSRFSVGEIAKLLGVTEHTVLGWIHNGELRAINVGRTPHGKKPRWRVSAEALDEFERLRNATPQPTVASRRSKRGSNDVIEFYAIR
jgi:excisionase family DNA binding protein